ncbi:MAG: ribonuclease Y [Nitrospirota bacterium]
MIDIIITAVISVCVGLGIGFFLNILGTRKKVKDAEEYAKKIIREAKKECDTKKREAALEAKDKMYQVKAEFDKEAKERRHELLTLEKRLRHREGNLDKKVALLDRKDVEFNRKERELLSREKIVSEKEKIYERGLKEQRIKLEKISRMTSEEAKRELMRSMEEEAKFEAAKTIKRIEEEARNESGQRAREIIVTAIQRYSSDYTNEATVSVVNLPNNDIKGKIIGREGRNIRALEALTGINLIIDDTPDAVIVSGFDPVRREIARISLERLMADGRIHPARIEETVTKVKNEIEKIMQEEAEQSLFDLNIQNVNQEEIKLLGRLKYRTSYGQNNLVHAREVAFLAGIMASELGLDVKLVKRASLLHDIGKAIDHNEEGTHAMIGADIAKKYGESPKIVNAIASHHGDIEAISPEAVLVAAADALSASRPGARRETLGSYIKRLEKLENLASTFKGVEKAYAIQAGRELRIIVKENEVSDVESSQISRDIAKRIEKELVYPGQIKVTVIRESRYIEYAK